MKSTINAVFALFSTNELSLSFEIENSKLFQGLLLNRSKIILTQLSQQKVVGQKMKRESF